MVPILMPQIGQDIKVGRVVEWHKKQGEAVRRGEVILTVESEKASFEVEAESDGVLLQVLCPENGEAEVLSPVGYIGQPGERRRGHSEQRPAAPATEAATAKVHASPSARRVARERAVRLEGLRGSGPGGRIVKADVLAVPAAKAAPAVEAALAAEAAPDTVIPFDRVRRIIAERLTRSSRDVPHFYLLQEVDMERALALREARDGAAARGGGAVHLTVTDLVLWAVVQALPSYPRLNAHVEAERLVQKARIDLGVAASTDRGLVVPVVRDAGRLSLEALAAEAHRVVEEARRGRLDPSAAGSFTVSSLGMFGVPVFFPLINPPECAILAVGAAEPRVVARDGLMGVRRTLSLVLGCDHRAVDGAYAAGFLQRTREILESGLGEEGGRGTTP
jgi:pyruvate dehydrogenase E2 component (dihydrolipoamide acetyltransferase)